VRQDSLPERIGTKKGVMNESQLRELREAKQRLERTLAASDSRKTLLQAWSLFIRQRDGWRCVPCNARKKLSAHHICRKSFLPEAQFQTGNGITLCPVCHGEFHRGFNGRPDMNLPMDAQGGEKLETLSWLYGALEASARSQGILGDEFYYLGDLTLRAFRRFQGYGEETSFRGCRLEQANLIWRVAPLDVVNAILRANGIEKRSEPFLPGITVIYD